MKANSKQSILCLPFKNIAFDIFTICVILTVFLGNLLSNANENNNLIDSYTLLFCIVVIFIFQMILAYKNQKEAEKNQIKSINYVFFFLIKKEILIDNKGKSNSGWCSY